MYLGQQEIIKEEKLDKTLIKLTVKPLELDELQEEEEVVILHKDVFERLKSEEPLMDETELRHIRSAPLIEKIVLTLIEYNCRIDDMNNIFMGVKDTIHQALLRQERKIYGNNETKRTIKQFTDELLK